MRRHRRALAALTATAALASLPAAAPAAPPGETTAWRDGALRVDTGAVVSRSDIVLEDPAWLEEHSMPLGNGRLGAAVWNRDGFTAQLNRNDTFPDLKSAGRLVVPGLMRLAGADDYAGRLDLHDAELEQRGGRMTARTYVHADRDQLVLEVTGASPRERQTAELTLWEGRRPTAYADRGIAALAETFTDADSGITTGQVAALTAKARDVEADVVDGDTVRLSFTPERDGSYRIVVGVPHWTGGDVARASRAAVADATDRRIERGHLDWWHRFWDRVAPLKITSDDGVGEYMEALRAQHMYTTAATQRNVVPTGQAGAANMIYPWRDDAVSPSTWFHFNLRQQVFGNLGAGMADFNTPYVRLYTDRLDRLREQTQQRWPGSEGVCIPELIQFDGTNDGCDVSAEPTWTNRILTGGLEVAHDIWLQYRYTGDRAILDRGWPLMRDVGRFYLSVLRPGEDGLLHLENANSHETQWDARDPTPDLAGMRVVFPIVADEAQRRGDRELAARLRDAVGKLPPLPIWRRNGEDVIGWSHTTDEAPKNTQNTDMEPLLPWGILGADSKLMQDSFRLRVFPLTREWGEDPIWAARLHLAEEMEQLLVQGTVDLQKFPNGFSVHGKNDDPAAISNMYSSWNAVVAGALQEGLVQDYDGTIRIAKSLPADWDAEGEVAIAGGHRVSTQVRDGEPNQVGIEAGSSATLTIENPWPGQLVRVVDGDRRHGNGRPVVRPTRADEIELRVRRGASYVLERVGGRPARFAPVTGAPETEVKHLGRQSLGVEGGTPQIVSDLVGNVSPEKLHALVPAREGGELYVDRFDTIASLPDALRGVPMIKGAQAESEETEPADYLSFELARPAPVHVAFDARGEGDWWPAWLQEQGFERTDMTVGTHDYLRRFYIDDDGRLRASGGGVTLSREGAEWGDVVFEATVHQVQVGASVMFRAPDRRNGYVWNIGGRLGSEGGLGQLQMNRMVDGRTTTLATVIPIALSPFHTYRLRIEAIGDTIRTFIDGRLVDERRDATFARGRIGFNLGGSDVGEYDDIKVSTPDGRVLFSEDFSGDLSKWEQPADRHDNPLVVFKKDMPAGRVTLGPPSGNGDGDAHYVTFVGENAR